MSVHLSAGQKAWITRHENEKAQKLSATAKKAWKTRRANAKDVISVVKVPRATRAQVQEGLKKAMATIHSRLAMPDMTVTVAAHPSKDPKHTSAAKRAWITRYKRYGKHGFKK